jgi:hypothetical protein
MFTLWPYERPGLSPHLIFNRDMKHFKAYGKVDKGDFCDYVRHLWLLTRAQTQAAHRQIFGAMPRRCVTPGTARALQIGQAIGQI